MRALLLVGVAAALQRPRAAVAARRVSLRACERADAVVVGCGPAGLAAAIELRRAGFAKVVAVERRDAAAFFEPQKSYLYLVDRRGQRWTDARRFTEAIAARGVSNAAFSVTRVYPDGRGVRTLTPALARPATAKAIWIPRASLLEVLSDAAADAGVDLRYGAAVEAIAAVDGGVDVAIAPVFGGVDATAGAVLRAPVVIGADGARSRVREFLESRGAPGPVRVRSPSGGLRYKMLELAPGFKVRDLATDATLQTESARAYTLPSLSRSRKRRLRLGLLPSRDPAVPRTANIIKPAGHGIWACASPADLREYLRREFPQLPDDAATDDALDAFASAERGAFPDPSYAPRVAARVGRAACFLVGDAAHAFPPDLGQGVNAAFEDVAALGDAVARPSPVATYAAARGPAAEALARIVACGFPYQYDQSFWRAKLFLAGVALRLAASKAAAAVLPASLARHVPPPVAFAVLDGDDYATAWRRATRATRAYAALGAALAATLLARAVL